MLDVKVLLYIANLYVQLRGVIFKKRLHHCKYFMGLLHSSKFKVSVNLVFFAVVGYGTKALPKILETKI